MEKVKLEIVGMSYSQSQSGAYALILGVVGMDKRLPIIIGGFEAQSIAIALEKMKPSRPLTHDLFKNFATHFGITIKEVVINKFEEGIFYSKLVCEKDGQITEIDSRTSDAIALALRFECPVYTITSIVDEAGITLTEEDEQTEMSSEHEVKRQPSESESKNNEETEEDLSVFLLEELENMLEKAINEENYEEASRIRDEIRRRKNQHS